MLRGSYAEDAAEVSRGLRAWGARNGVWPTLNRMYGALEDPEDHQGHPQAGWGAKYVARQGEKGCCDLYEIRYRLLGGKDGSPLSLSKEEIEDAQYVSVLVVVLPPPHYGDTFLLQRRTPLCFKDIQATMIPLVGVEASLMYFWVAPTGMVPLPTKSWIPVLGLTWSPGSATRFNSTSWSRKGVPVIDERGVTWSGGCPSFHDDLERPRAPLASPGESSLTTLRIVATLAREWKDSGALMLASGHPPPFSSLHSFHQSPHQKGKASSLDNIRRLQERVLLQRRKMLSRYTSKRTMSSLFLHDYTRKPGLGEEAASSTAAPGGSGADQPRASRQFLGRMNS